MVERKGSDCTERAPAAPDTTAECGALDCPRDEEKWRTQALQFANKKSKVVVATKDSSGWLRGCCVFFVSTPGTASGVASSSQIAVTTAGFVAPWS